MNNSPNTLLLIADISGYTRFMKQHAISISHAKQIIVRLLTVLVSRARPPLKVAELEGDAVFLYALTNGSSLDAVAQKVKEQVLEFFAAFQKELHAIDSLRTCPCDACTHIGNLQLKQVLHAGVVAVERIGRFEKLFGLDVILVHRMLKNSVQANEYVMMTERAYAHIGDFYGLVPERFKETFEGVGEIETLVFYPRSLLSPVELTTAEVLQVSPFDKWKWRWQISYKTLLEWLGIRKIEGVFDGLPT